MEGQNRNDKLFAPYRFKLDSPLNRNGKEVTKYFWQKRIHNLIN